MKDADTNVVLTDKEILKEALGHLSDACGFLYELNSNEEKVLAIMVDACIKCGQALYHDADPRDSLFIS